MTDDLISRQAVLDRIRESIETYHNQYTTDMLNMWGLFTQFIKEMPSVNPQEPKTDVLDKIRAEIETLIEWHDCPIEYDNGNDAWYCEACNQAIRIIDKYKAESEDNK